MDALEQIVKEKHQVFKLHVQQCLKTSHDAFRDG